MSVSWINKLNESDSRLHKEEVLRKALTAASVGSENADTFLTLSRACYNPFVTFGVKQIPETKNLSGRENPWGDFVDLMGELATRKLTGQAARDAIETMSNRFDSSEWNGFCRAVLRKDLRAGVSEKTINKIAKKTKYEIPIFSCQLATNSEGRPEMSGVKRLEPKLDGVRVIMVVNISDDGQVSATCYSRNGKIFENFSHIEDQILDNLKPLVRAGGKYFINGFVLDGEVIGNSFQELMRQARRKKDAQADDSVFNIFDVLPLAEFAHGHWNMQLAKRIAILEEMRPTIDKMPNVELLPHITVNLDTSAGRDQLHRYAKDMVNAGFEGIMIKNVAAPYECSRNTFWMKWKPTITVDLKVTDLQEGTGKHAGRLGAFICEGTDDGKFIQVNVGSGITDEERTEIWNNKSKVIGRTVEILCDVITQNQDGSYSLRFPRFVRFRDDK